ncbi:MAG: hypothetical protein DMG89_06800 [Acidobacteria bacterium]|nr:MAG: hypothetical protein DMG89_06800 [Acidobacteriota bacterium]
MSHQTAPWLSFTAARSDRHRVLTLIVLSIFFFSLSACESTMQELGSSTSTATSTSRSNGRNDSVPQRFHRIRITVVPATATVASRGQRKFTAKVHGISIQSIAWSVTAGIISEDGTFIAPVVNGTTTVTVTASSTDLSRAFATAFVTVLPSTQSPSTPLNIITRFLPSSTQGKSYSAPVLIDGGQAPYRWTIPSGYLPRGLTLDSTSGLISGASLQTGTFSFKTRVSDSANNAATRRYTMVVSAGTENPGACGPPTYGCSRTDFDIVQLPGSVPDIGNLSGAGRIIIDPDFHNPIVRLTDAHTNPKQENVTFVTGSGGSSNASTWNTDSTMIFLQDTNATGYPMLFDANTMQASRMYVPAFPSTGGMTISAKLFSWSRTNPNYLYVVSGVRLLRYDFTNRNVPPSPQLVYDFTSSPNCLPHSFTPVWSNFGGISDGDAAFTVGYSNTGFQGTGVYVVVYSVGKGCSMVNTQTGQITSDWGQSGSMSTPDRFTLHDAFMTKSDGWAMLGSTKCLSTKCSKGPYFWQLGSTMVTPCGANGTVELCSGHWTMGHTRWINNDGDPFGQYHMRSFSALGSHTPVITALPVGLRVPLDHHPSWNNADVGDALPFFSSTWSPITPFPSAWYNEIIGISPITGSGWRFAHSFISANSHRFSTKYGIGQVSQDGRFFLFSSDWMGTLGSESGSSSCAVGVNCRGDVFAIELK